MKQIDDNRYLLQDLKISELRRLNECYIDHTELVEKMQLLFMKLYDPKTYALERSNIKNNNILKKYQEKLSLIKNEINNISYVLKMLKFFKHHKQFQILDSITKDLYIIKGVVRNDIIFEFILEERAKLRTWMQYSAFSMFNNYTINNAFREYIDMNNQKIIRRIKIKNL